MKLIPVENSSNVKAVGYDPQTREMRVQFNGGAIYTHEGVPHVEHAKFIASPSKGTHYHQNFRGKFGVKKLGPL
jgi:hypothetical protein